MAASLSVLLRPKFCYNFRLFSTLSKSNRFLANGLGKKSTLKSYDVQSSSIIRYSARHNSNNSDSSDDESLKLGSKPRNRREERKKLKQETKPAEKEELTYAEKVSQAAEAVGKLSDNPEKITADLLGRLQSKTNGVKSDNVDSKKEFSLGELLSGMKTEDPSVSSQRDKSRSHTTEEDFIVERKGSLLLTSKRLDIFDPDIMNIKRKSPPTLFDELEEEERQAFANFPPNNAFEEMIQWTKDGKLWHFPIDNEQGLDEEKQVPFTEHVFLDHLLEGFPKKGPIRHFMELVIVALSKNPYLTVQEKHDQVSWFRDYFKDKLHLVEIVDSQEKIEAK